MELENIAGRVRASATSFEDLRRDHFLGDGEVNMLVNRIKDKQVEIRSDDPEIKEEFESLGRTWNRAKAAYSKI